MHNPELTSRGNYMPISFVPHQNTFYYALPYNDVEQGHSTRRRKCHLLGSSRPMRSRVAL